MINVQTCLLLFTVLGYGIPVSGSRQVLCSFPENNSKPMMAYIRMTNSTSRAIWNNGIMARRIELSTTCKPKNTGIPNTTWSRVSLDSLEQRKTHSVRLKPNATDEVPGKRARPLHRIPPSPGLIMLCLSCWIQWNDT